MHVGNNQTTYSQLLINNVIVSQIWTTDYLTQISTPYDDAPEIQSGQTIVLSADPGYTGNTAASVTVVEESAAPGYFTN